MFHKTPTEEAQRIWNLKQNTPRCVNLNVERWSSKRIELTQKANSTSKELNNSEK
jgi:hypothetical protein